MTTLLSSSLRVIAVGALLAAVAVRAVAEPALPGFSIEQYSSVPSPQQVSVDPTGVLFVGNGTNQPDYPPVQIHRVVSDDQLAEDYGAAGLRDPDGVVVDSDGSITGTPGSVLVGSYAGSGRGQVAVIYPDQSVAVLWGPTTAFTNINSLLFDSTRRLLFLDTEVKKVFASTGDFPSVLFSQANSLASIAIDSVDRIYTSDFTGTVAVHAPDGTLINGALATGLGTWPVLLHGPCGVAWDDLLYVINYDTGEFLKIDANGDRTVIGSGFQGASWATFGPDCALYVTLPGRIVRILPVSSGSPMIPGLSTEIFASLPLPQQLSFDQSGGLFVGNGTNHPNYPPVPIWRIGLGGIPVEEYGNEPLSDPDGVHVDALGTIAGVSGAVLVGSYAGNGNGQIAAVYPDGSVAVLWQPSPLLGNPNTLLIDSSGRLLILDMGGTVLASTGDSPTALFSSATALVSMAIDAVGRIYTSDIGGTIAIHAPDGSLMNDALVTGLGSSSVLFHGPCGTAWGDFLYSTNSGTGELLQIDDYGVTTVVGTDFQDAGWATFGPDRSLYVTFPESIVRFSDPVSSVRGAMSSSPGGLLVAPVPARTGESLEIRLSLTSPGPVWLDLYDVHGRLCSSAVERQLPVGVHILTWRPQDLHGQLASGAYVLRATCGGRKAVQRVVFIR